MHVARLELCKELFELSGWNDVSGIHWWKKRVSLADGTWTLRNTYPQYDLGYLLRKLQDEVSGRIGVAWSDGFQTWYSFREDLLSEDGDVELKGDSPEDAVCYLAITLIKQGVLEKS